MTELSALIGTRESLRGSGTDPMFVHLSQGFVLVPVDEDAWVVIGSALADDLEVAADLSRFLEVILGAVGLRQDAPGPVAYLELNEFTQSGFVALDGTVIDSFITEFDGSRSQTPEAEWAFNRSLRHLGVQVGGARDECEAVGLASYLADKRSP